MSAKQPEPGPQLIPVDYPVAPREREWKGVPARLALEERLKVILPAAQRLLGRIAGFHEQFVRIPAQRKSNHVDGDPFWNNGWFPALDGVVLYGMLALENPRLYVEVGSGNSTTFARRAIREHGLRTRIISIDPHPRAAIDKLCDEVYRQQLEQIDVRKLNMLTSEDIFFLDSSHRSFQNSDVTVFFEEILPSLPAGLRYGLHDIYLPADYPQALADRFYNEQYLLSSYLAGGADGDEIVLPNSYLFRDTDLVAKALGRTFDQVGLTQPERFGNSFWMRRAPARAR